MPGEKLESSNMIFLNINQGALRQTVDENNPEGKARTYTKKDGSVKTVHEISYKTWTGVIKRITVKDTEWGQFVVIKFKDASIDIPVKSRFFGSFVERIMGADLSKEITFKPYDFEGEDGRRAAGVILMQDGKKLKNYFKDENNKPCNGMPPVNEAEKDRKGYWEQYFHYTVANFFLDQLSTLTFGKEISKTEDELPTINLDDEIPTINLDEVNINEEHIEKEKTTTEEKEAVDLSQVPF
jgi:hypothetical protein